MPDEPKSYEPNYENHDFEYFKVTEYKIRPSQELIRRSKDVENPIEYGKFSIDGEAYPIDNYKAKMLPKYLEVYTP